MIFDKILPELLKGKRVRRKCWGKYCWIVVLFPGKSNIVLTQYNNPYVISNNAVFATDWEVL